MIGILVTLFASVYGTLLMWVMLVFGLGPHVWLWIMTINDAGFSWGGNLDENTKGAVFLLLVVWVEMLYITYKLNWGCTVPLWYAVVMTVAAVLRLIKDHDERYKF